MALDRIGITLEANTVGEDRLKAFEDAINRMSAKAESASKASTAGGDVDVSKFGQQIKEFIENPLQSAGEQAKKFLEQIGPMGVQLAALGGAAIAATAGLAELSRQFGDQWEQLNNNSIRLGVTTREYSVLAQVSKEAGLASDSFVGAMKGLSKALSDNEQDGKKAKGALSALGIQAKDTFGDIRPMVPLLEDIASKIGEIQDPAERARRSIEIFGRAGLNLLPQLNSELRQQIEEVNQSSVAWSQFDQQIGRMSDNLWDKAGRRLSAISKTLKEIAALSFVGGGPFGVLPSGIGAAVDAQTAQDAENQRMLGRTWKVKAPEGMLEAQWAAAMQTPGDSRTALDQAHKALKDATDNYDLQAVRAAQTKVRLLEAQVRAEEKARSDSEAMIKRNEDIRLAAFGAIWEKHLPQPPKATATGGIDPLLWQLDMPFLEMDKALNEEKLKQAAQFNRFDILKYMQNSARLSINDWSESSTLGLSRLSQATDYSARKAELTAPMGFEVQAAQNAAAIRIAGIEQAKKLGMDINQADLDILRIRQDAELQILSINRQRIAESKQQGGQLFDALTAGGAGISKYVSGLGLGFGRTAFSNIFAELSTGLQGKFSLPGQGTASNPNLLGRILQGTPFGIDQNSAAGAVQMTAAQIQLQAATTMAGAVTSTAAIGGFGSSGSGLTSLIQRTLPMLAPNYSGTVSAGSTGYNTSDEWYQAALDLPNYPASNKMTLGKGVGIAGAAIGGAYGAYSGFSSGGARGITTGIGSLAGAAGAITSLAGVTGPLAPILMGVGLGLGFVSTLFGDPKKKRADQLSAEASDRAYTDPTGSTYTRDSYGRNVDYSANGAPRVFIEIKALDSQSIVDRQADISEAVRQGLSTYPPLTEDLRATANYR